MNILKNISLFVVALAIFQTCSPVDEDTFCTEVFTIISVTVQTPSGDPANDVDFTITEEESGEVIPCDDYLCQQNGDGRYTIMHDGLRETLSSSGDTFIIEGTKDGLQFQHEFTFRNDGCHVEKISGPDTVQLTEPTS